MDRFNDEEQEIMTTIINLAKQGQDDWTEDDYQAYCEILISFRDALKSKIKNLHCHNEGLAAQLEKLKELAREKNNSLENSQTFSY